MLPKIVAASALLGMGLSVSVGPVQQKLVQVTAEVESTQLPDELKCCDGTHPCSLKCAHNDAGDTDYSMVEEAGLSWDQLYPHPPEATLPDTLVFSEDAADITAQLSSARTAINKYFNDPIG